MSNSLSSDVSVNAWLLSSVAKYQMSSADQFLVLAKPWHDPVWKHELTQDLLSNSESLYVEEVDMRLDLYHRFALDELGERVAASFCTNFAMPAVDVVDSGPD